MKNRAGEWRIFADRALVLQLAFLEERPDRALTAATRMLIRRCRLVLVIGFSGDFDHLALRADQRLFGLTGSSAGAGAAAQREEAGGRERD